MASSLSSYEEFANLNLSKWLVEQCLAMGIKEPTPVQRYCIPQILEGRNCLAVSQTGTGKTLAFVLPMLQVLNEDPYGVFALILTPTRELAIQIAEQIKVIGKPMNVEVCLITGGFDQVVQGYELSKQPQIVVATPGRLADMMESSYDVYFRRIKFLVVDEADRILGEHFLDQLEVILKAVKNKFKKQILLFSATNTENLEKTVRGAVADKAPFVWKSDAEVTTVEGLKQQYVVIRNLIVKSATLVQVIKFFQEKYPYSSMIIFTQNCSCCQVVSHALNNLGFENVALNSFMKQRERMASMIKFKSNRIKILIATDIASRGLDIPMVDMVINFSVPRVPTDYIHRVGRTARAGRVGLALTFVSTESEIRGLHRIENEINYRLTEFKIPGKKVLEHAVEVEVAWREAAISLEDDETSEKKEIYKRKKSLINGDDDPQNKKPKQNGNEKFKKTKRQPLKCFNCLGDHYLKQCPDKVDDLKISANRKEMLGNSRQQVMTCFNCLGNHYMKQCPEKVDETRIAENRKKISGISRERNSESRLSNSKTVVVKAVPAK